MSRITPVNPTLATSASQNLLVAVQNKMGMTPNLMKTLAHSSAALEGYLNFNESLSKGVLKAQLRELISVAVAESNACEYCLSAHTALGKRAKLDEQSILSARKGESNDPKIASALRFVKAILVSPSAISDEDIEEMRVAGYTEEEIVEIISNVALNIYTNYFNVISQTEIDFPKVELLPR